MTAALIFDFDGTIVDTETTLFQAWSELYESHGQVLDIVTWQRIIGTDDPYDPWHELIKIVGPLDESHNESRRDRRDQLIDQAGVRLGVERWLDDADELGIPMGIASSSPIDWVEHHLDRLGLLDRFACFACVNELIPAKPDPASYVLACEALHADPKRSVAVEDSPHGIAAAKDAGLFVVAVPHALTATLDLSRADLIVESLGDVTLAEVLARN